MSGLNSVRVEWSNHGFVLGKSMWKIFIKKPLSVEHELTFQGKVIDIHFVILEALCENFSSDKILAFNDADQKNIGSKISFAINGVNDETLNCFLEFAYRGTTVLSADSLKTFLVLVLQAGFRDLDQIHVLFFDVKSVTENDVDHLDSSVNIRPTDSPQNDSSLSEYLDAASASNEEDWSKINLDSFVFSEAFNKVFNEAITNKNFDEFVGSSQKTPVESVNLDVLELSQVKNQSCYHVNDILRCCTCLLKEHQHNLTITFSNSESEVIEHLRGPNICNICSIESAISVTAEKVQPKEDADYFLNNYISRLIQDDVLNLNSYSQETFSPGFSNFCSETKPKIKTEVAFNCMVCNQSHNSEILLARHMITAHSNNMALLAPKVNKVDESSGTRPLEMAEKNSKIRQTGYRNKNSAVKGKNSVERDKFRCVTCDYKSCNVFEFKCHRFQHVRRSPFKCDDCGIKFSVKDTLYRHIWNNHCELNDFLKCNYCDFKTLRKQSLERHENWCRKSCKYRESLVSKQRKFGTSQMPLKHAVIKILKL